MRITVTAQPETANQLLCRFLKHVAVGRFYRPMVDVGAGSVDQREAFPVSGNQACLSAWNACLVKIDVLLWF